jgi:hypothetical protein
MKGLYLTFFGCKLLIRAQKSMSRDEGFSQFAKERNIKETILTYQIRRKSRAE